MSGSRERGATLIELLTVGAVLAVLAGLLAPSLAGAREASRSAACAANARSLVTAMIAFAGDHDGRAVAGAPDIGSTNLLRWHGVRDNVGETFDPARGPMASYLAQGGTMRACPSFARALDALAERGAGFESGCGGYAYNNAFLGTDRRRQGGVWVVRDARRGASIERFRSPARTAAFADGAFAANDGLIEYSFLEPRFWPEWPGARPDPSAHFRHGGRVVVVWLDGHTTGEQRTFTAWSGLYAEDPAPLDLGWFGDEDDNSLLDYE